MHEDAVLSSGPAGRTKQGGSHAEEQWDQILVIGGPLKGPGIKVSPDQRHHYQHNGHHNRQTREIFQQYLSPRSSDPRQTGVAFVVLYLFVLFVSVSVPFVLKTIFYMADE